MRELTKNQLIEQSIISTYRSKLWAPFIKALKDYELIKPNDHICVCISGGKDSFLMAKLFQELQSHSDFEFKVTYLAMNPGYKEENMALILENAKLMEIPLKIVESDIFEVAELKGGKPCFLCARMRRGCLYKHAQELGCNKIALGHHFNDVIETTLMSMFYNGRFQSMMPKVVSDNFEGMELIRPLYLIHEHDIITWSKHNNLKFLQCACRFTEGKEFLEEDSKRREMKHLIESLKENNPQIEKNIFMSHHNVNLATCVEWDDDLDNHHSFKENYGVKKYGK